MRLRERERNDDFYLFEYEEFFHSLFFFFFEVGWHPPLFPAKAHRVLNRSLAGRTCSLALERTWKQLYRPCALFDNQAMACWVIACYFDTKTEKDLECTFKAQIFISAAINVWSKRNHFRSWQVAPPIFMEDLLEIKELATTLDRTCRDRARMSAAVPLPQ